MPIIYLFVALVCLVGAVSCFRANLPYRQAINVSAAKDGLLIPERMWPFYDASYLNTFIAKSRERQTTYGKNSLELYVHPTLLWIDVGFAVFCGAFAALLWLGILEMFPENWLAKGVLLFLFAMSVTYGVADIAEDLWLARLFSRSTAVTKIEGGIACALTETKIIAISLSVAGGLLFKALDVSFSKGAIKNVASPN